MNRECLCQSGYGYIKEYYEAKKKITVVRVLMIWENALRYSVKWKVGYKIACKLQSPLYIG